MTLTLQVMLSFLRHHLLQFRRSHVTLLCLAADADRCGLKLLTRQSPALLTRDSQVEALAVAVEERGHAINRRLLR